MNTGSIEIRQTREEDLPFLQALWADGDVMRFVGFPNGLKMTLDEMRHWLQRIEQGRPMCDHYSIYENKMYCGETFYQVDIRHDHLASLDIKLFSEFRGRGIAYRSLRFAIEKAFANSAGKVYVDPSRENSKALRLYEHLGFTEAPMPAHLLADLEQPERHLYLEIDKHRWPGLD